MRRTYLALVAICMLIGWAVPVQAADAGPDSSLFPSDNERFGVDVASDITRFDVTPLHAGWYANWRTNAAPTHPAGMEFVQLIKLCDDQYRTCATPYQPYGEELKNTIRSVPGSLWLISNEPDRLDLVHPTVYAQLYHELYYLIKGIDPTARVAIGGVVQATPLRMQWLNMVWSEYRRLYQETMPVDVWNVHGFVLRELKPGLPLDRLLKCAPPGARDLGAWGAGIPPGIDADCGMWIEIGDHDDMDIFKAQIQRFRRWMRDHGQRNKELIVSEYGILFNEELGFDAERVRDFMYATFDYFLNTRDGDLGMPADGDRLVQRWAWFSLEVTSFSWGHTRSALFDPKTRQMTYLGRAFSDYTASLVTPYVDLTPKAITYTVLQSPLWATDPTKLRIEGTIINRGNTAAGAFKVRFWNGLVGSGTPIREKDVSGVPSRYAGDATTTIVWDKPQAQGTTITLQADARHQIEESNEQNNTLSMTLDLPLDLTVDPPDTSHPIPIAADGSAVDVPLYARVHSLGGRGSDQAITVEFWDGDPETGGELIGSDQLQPGSDGMAHVVWHNRLPGTYRVFARIIGVSDDANPANNTSSSEIYVGRLRYFLPIATAN
ncbi:MAG: hypothetical protein J7M34_03280 [Anaerolineae bacterium]|nr:hypothetical protein [Anaerolineae bacterium]